MFLQKTEVAAHTADTGNTSLDALARR